RAAAIDTPVAHFGRERIYRPARAGRHDVVVSVEVQDRPLTTERADKIDARALRGVLRQAFRGEGFGRVSKCTEPRLDQRHTVAVAVTGRIDGWNPYQVLREGDHVVRKPLDLFEHGLFGGGHPVSELALGNPWSGVAARTARTIASATTSAAARPSVTGSCS